MDSTENRCISQTQGCGNCKYGICWFVACLWAYLGSPALSKHTLPIMLSHVDKRTHYFKQLLFHGGEQVFISKYPKKDMKDGYMYRPGNSKQNFKQKWEKFHHSEAQIDTEASDIKNFLTNIAKHNQACPNPELVADRYIPFLLGTYRKLGFGGYSHEFTESMPSLYKYHTGSDDPVSYIYYITDGRSPHYISVFSCSSDANFKLFDNGKIVSLNTNIASVWEQADLYISLNWPAHQIVDKYTVSLYA
jgi:hypothetical protein